MRHSIGTGARFAAAVAARGPGHEGLRMRGDWGLVARAPGILKNPKTGLWIPGEVKWEVEYKNLVVNQGLNHALDVLLHGTTAVATWFLALLKTTPAPASTWTYANTMGTANQEVTAYSESVRQTYVEAAAASQSTTNSASPAVFTINANGTVVGGAALVSNSTKNDTAAAGAVMYAAGAFTAADKSLDNLDTLTVTATFTAADDGV